MEAKKDHELRTFRAGEVLFKEGDPGGELWIIRSGEVEIFRERSGRVFHLGVVSKGEILGTMTATTGAPRQASARAQTEIEVNIVPVEQMQRLIKSIPPWANTFIKDLISRVNYANDLYVDAELAAQGGLAGPIDLAARVASVLSGMADLLAVDGKDGRIVPLAAAVERLGTVLGFKEDVRKILAILGANGMLAGSGEGFTLSSAAELRLFADLIAKAQSLQPTPGVFSLPLAQGQRKLLGEIARLGIARTGGKATGTLVVKLKELEDELRRNKAGALDVDALDRGTKLGYLALVKEGEESTLHFDPRWLDYVLRSLEAMSQVLTTTGTQAGARRKQQGFAV